MDDQAKVARLMQALDEPEGKYTHDQIRQRLYNLQQGRERASVGAFHDDSASGRPGPEVDMEPQEVPETPGGFARRVGSQIEEGARLPVHLGHRAVNAATFGGFDAGLNLIDRAAGTRFGVHPDEQAADEANHPWMTGTANAVGYVAPVGLPARAGEAIGRGVDALTSTIAKRAAGSATGRLAVRAGTGAATGAATGGLTRGLETSAAGGSPSDVGREALQGAKTGGALGAPLGAAAGAAGELAAKMRASSPDLAILHKYGLEPGPVPGRPVIREDQAIHSQLPGVSEPPLGVSRATPATRGAAARAAADEIVPDMAERARANNQQFGELQAQAYKAEGRNPARISEALTRIDQHLNDPGLPDTTKVALSKLRQRMIDQSMPTRLGIFTRADNLDRLRDYADFLGRQERTAKASDVPIRQVADLMRDSVREAAPGIAALNAQQAGVLTGFEQRRAVLGVPKPPERGGATSEKALQGAAGRIQQSGEETATGGRATVRGRTRSERLADMGAPPTLPGTQVPPEPTYGASLAMPRLQLAQENLQVRPSKVFSGGGMVPVGAGLGHRLLHYLPERVIYPLSRRLGDANLSTIPQAADPLLRALRGRRQGDDELAH